LDAGALIALERNRRELWAALEAAALAGDDVRVPSTVIAQVWRDRPSQARDVADMAHLLDCSSGNTAVIVPC
jgi:hypothetical protein